MKYTSIIISLCCLFFFIFLYELYTTNLSINKHQFEVISKEYEDILDLKEINGKLSFLATNDKFELGAGRFPVISRKWFIVYDGREIGKEYPNIAYFTSINNKLTYVVDDYLHFSLFDQFIIYDDIKINDTENGYILTNSPTEIDGKLAFKALKGFGERYWNSTKEGYVLVYNGTEGSVYNDIKEITDIDGKPAFFAEKNNSWFLVYNGYEDSRRFDNVEGPIKKINNKITFTAITCLYRRLGNTDMLYLLRCKKYIIHGDEEIGKNYDDAMNPIEINGSLVYLARKDGRNFIIYDGKEIGGQYDDVDGPFSINGKLAYKAFINQNKTLKSLRYLKGWFIVYDDKEIGKQYDEVSDPLYINGKIVFVAYTEKDDYIKSFIVYNGNEVGKEYIRCYNPISINNKLAFIAERDNKKSVVVKEI